VQSAPESVSLNWQASSSPGVIGYYVYRGAVSGGPYTVLNSSPTASTQYLDASTLAGMTYYYVVTSVDSGNMQSGFSSQVSANVPAR
jgi:fibronectin type 3 domain-containing protein